MRVILSDFKRFLMPHADYHKLPPDFLGNAYKDGVPSSCFMRIRSPPLAEVSFEETRLDGILVSLWKANERDRLTWLRNNAKLQPVLMFELAVEELFNDPTTDKIADFVLPQMKAAAFRTKQDAYCLGTLDSRATSSEIVRIYQEVVQNMWEQHQEGEPWPLESKEANQNRISAVLTDSREFGLPSPAWIAGLDNFDTWETMRNSFAKRFKVLEV